MKKWWVWIICLFPMIGLAELNVKITEGSVAPIPVAFLHFETSPTLQKMADEIRQVTMADLSTTRLFNFLDDHSFLQPVVPLNVLPRFADWRMIKTQFLINGTFDKRSDGKVEVKLRVWDIYLERQVTAVVLETEEKYWRRLAHIVSDHIYQAITGEMGHFDTRIVYVAEVGPQGARQKRLAIMDQDGANHKYLTDNRTIVLTPRFAPNHQKLCYMSFAHKIPHVYLLDLNTGMQELVGSFPGMTFAPRFSPDGKSILLSQALNGRTSIYSMDLASKQVKRLTNGACIDTSPSYSPNGKQIVFSSDRGGPNQLYVMNSDGSNAKRISFGSGTYATPIWSPRGDLIAFTKLEKRQFYIGVMKSDGSGERLLARGFVVEGPAWAPNGRVVMFARQTKSDHQGNGGTAKIYAVDIAGVNEYLVTTPQDGSDPAWSPLGFVK